MTGQDRLHYSSLDFLKKLVLQQEKQTSYGKSIQCTDERNAIISWIQLDRIEQHGFTKSCKEYSKNESMFKQHAYQDLNGKGFHCLLGDRRTSTKFEKMSCHFRIFIVGWHVQNLNRHLTSNKLHYALSVFKKLKLRRIY